MMECPSCGSKTSALFEGVCRECRVAETVSIDRFHELKARVSKYRLESSQSDSKGENK